MVDESHLIDPKEIVARGYDRVGWRYTELAIRADFDERAQYVDMLIERLPAGAKVLDLGCGAGVPTTRQLASHFDVTGVDISGRQIDRARYNVSNATFMQADMAALDFSPASFDAITAFYSIIHLPRDEQPKLLQSIATWLRPEGLLVATMGVESTEAGFEELWLGASMFWSSFDSETNRRFIEEAGLRIISATVKTSESHGGSETFLWIVAQKPA
ncbi:MAG: class I SAM-dependent methyltransferase [Chloroflexi bacterium]|nr:class I SAM-dependent methyltransferase [Chloroflexota bacterium]